MSTTPPADMTFPQRWSNFWFAPKDPTTLGFMRAVTGLLVLYIVLAHTLDLQTFFGKYAWFGHDFAERDRREFPWGVSSFTSWKNEEAVMPRLPEFPHRRAAVLKFIRGLPAGKAERERGLLYLDRAARESNVNAVTALNFLLVFHEDGKGQEDAVYAALSQGRQLYRVAEGGRIIFRDTAPLGRESQAVIPSFLLGLPEPDRQRAAENLRTAALPADATDTKYLVNHLIEQDPLYRVELVRFMRDLPDDPAARTDRIDYLDYWNNDPDPNKLRMGQNVFSVWFHVTDPAAMRAVHVGILCAIVLFTVGACTRVSGVLTWVGVLGYVHRSDQTLFGMDTMANILVTYLVIGDSGAALSVDRLVAKYRAARASLARCGRIDAATRAFLDRAPDSRGAGFGVRLVQVHFCFIYLAAGLSKLKGQGWWNGYAFYDVMINPEFTMMHYHWFESLVRWLASMKPVYYVICTFGVWFTLALEISFPFLVWTRLRPFFLWLAVLLHAGIGILMGLTMFELLMMVMLLAYMPPGVIRDRLRGGPGLPKLRFGFDPAVPAQARAAALVSAADADGQVSLEPAAGVAQPTVRGAAESRTGAAAAGELFGTLRLLRFARHLLKLPGASGVAGKWVSPAA